MDAFPEATAAGAAPDCCGVEQLIRPFVARAGGGGKSNCALVNSTIAAREGPSARLGVELGRTTTKRTPLRAGGGPRPVFQIDYELHKRLNKRGHCSPSAVDGGGGIVMPSTNRSNSLQLFVSRSSSLRRRPLTCLVVSVPTNSAFFFRQPERDGCDIGGILKAQIGYKSELVW